MIKLLSFANYIHNICLHNTHLTVKLINNNKNNINNNSNNTRIWHIIYRLTSNRQKTNGLRIMSPGHMNEVNNLNICLVLNLHFLYSE